MTDGRYKQKVCGVYSVSYTHLDVYKRQVLAVETELTPEAFKSTHTNEVVDKTFETVYQALKHKGEKIATVAYPILHNLYETQGDKFKRIIIPITDGNKAVSYTHLDVYKRQIYG